MGNLPGTDPRDLTSLYDQLNLRYSIQSLALKVRVEQFYPSYGDDKNYTKLSQYNVKYTTPKLE
ncbi:MAG: hypothetical protein ACWGNV_08955, partial [Bacteroidales bacterium]